jgi:hypothetical protein
MSEGVAICNIARRAQEVFREANEVTVRDGDLSITYRSDAGSAAFPHRAEPVIPKDGRMIYSLPKVSAQAWAVGQAIYWDNVARNCTAVGSGNSRIGVATAAAANRARPAM